MPKYIELLLQAKEWFLFFDRTRAEDKAEELRGLGKRAEIVAERGAWTVFELIK